MARSLSSRSGGLGLPERVWVTTTKFAVVDHTRSGHFYLPAIARSGNLGGRRSVLGGARMYGSQLQ